MYYTQNIAGNFIKTYRYYLLLACSVNTLMQIFQSYAIIPFSF